MVEGAGGGGGGREYKEWRGKTVRVKKVWEVLPKIGHWGV